MPAILRVYGHGHVPVENVQDFLSAISECYNSVYAFDVALRHLAEDGRRFLYPEPFWHIAPLAPWRNLSELRARYLVPAGSHLLLRGVSLQSPGFWDFLGSLNPLEVIRKYLVDRHERRKDREYREDAEREKLRLENQLLETELVKRKVDILKEHGIRIEDLAPLLNRLVHDPLERLGRVQDQRLIESAEIIKNGD